MAHAKRQKRKRDRRQTLPQVIRAAIEREMKKMEDEKDRPQHSFKGGEINGWTGDALASHVAPGVLRSVSAWLRSL